MQFHVVCLRSLESKKDRQLSGGVLTSVFPRTIPRSPRKFAPKSSRTLLRLLKAMHEMLSPNQLRVSHPVQVKHTPNFMCNKLFCTLIARHMSDVNGGLLWSLRAVLQGVCLSMKGQFRSQCVVPFLLFIWLLKGVPLYYI